MSGTALKHLFSPITIRGKTIKNRILSTGHDTTMPTDSLPNDRLVAYHKARAEGGVGLIIVQVAGVHDSARYTTHVLMATTDECIPGYKKIADVCHANGTTVFGQLFHPGREVMESAGRHRAGRLCALGRAQRALSRNAARRCPRRMIREIVDGYGERRAAADARPASTASRSWPAMAICRRSSSTRAVNLRERRLWRHVREPPALPARDHRRDPARMTATNSSSASGSAATSRIMPDCRTSEALEAMSALDGRRARLSTTSSPAPRRRFAGAVHIAAPMALEHGYVAPFAAAAEGAGEDAGLRRRPHQPAAGCREDPRLGPGRHGAA